MAFIMRKILLVLSLILICPAFAAAQDIIVMNDGAELQVKVIEITPGQIKYKKFSNPDGPTYSMDKSGVLMIRYQNGDKDVIAQPKKETIATTARPAPAPVPAAPVEKIDYTPRSALSFRGAISMGAIMIEDVKDNQAGPLVSAGLNYEFFFPTSKTSDVIMAFGVNYEMALFKYENVRTEYDRVNFDLYFGERSRKFYYTGGFRLGCNIGVKTGLDDQLVDVKESCNGAQFGMIGGFGYWGNSLDAGIVIAYMMSNFYKRDIIQLNSSNVSVGLSLGVHF